VRVGSAQMLRRRKQVQRRLDEARVRKASVEAQCGELRLKIQRQRKIVLIHKDSLHPRKRTLVREAAERIGVLQSHLTTTTEFLTRIELREAEYLKDLESFPEGIAGAATHSR
jgi:hypothetical protein